MGKARAFYRRHPGFVGWNAGLLGVCFGLVAWHLLIIAPMRRSAGTAEAFSDDGEALVRPTAVHVAEAVRDERGASFAQERHQRQETRESRRDLRLLFEAARTRELESEKRDAERYLQATLHVEAEKRVVPLEIGGGAVPEQPVEYQAALLATGDSGARPAR